MAGRGHSRLHSRVSGEQQREHPGAGRVLVHLPGSRVLRNGSLIGGALMVYAPRIILQSLPSGEILDWAVPLGGADVTRVRTGPGALSGVLAEGCEHPVREWGAALWVESDGVFHGGGIVATVEHADREIRVNCTGITGYAQDMPWLAKREDLIEVDPLDIVRMIWDHLQDASSGNLHLSVDSLSSPVRVGEEEHDVEFSTGDGDDVSFVTRSFQLITSCTHELAKVIEDLAGDTPFV